MKVENLWIYKKTFQSVTTSEFVWFHVIFSQKYWISICGDCCCKHIFNNRQFGLEMPYIHIQSRYPFLTNFNVSRIFCGLYFWARNYWLKTPSPKNKKTHTIFGFCWRNFQNKVYSSSIHISRSPWRCSSHLNIEKGLVCATTAVLKTYTTYPICKRNHF